MEELEIQNIANIRELNTIIHSNNKKVAAFIGAGTSVLLGIPDWLTLISKMAKEYKWTEIGKLQKIEKIKNKIKEIQKDKKSSLQKIAQSIYETKDKYAFKSFLKDQCSPKIGFHYSIHIKIWNTFDIILTTNFDLAFSEAHNDIKNVLKSRGTKEERNEQILDNFHFDEILPNEKHQKSICYLHGNVNNDEIILCENHYKEYYPSCYNENDLNNIVCSDKLETLLKQIISDYHVVFIGFSFEDEIFNNFYEMTIKRLRNRFLIKDEKIKIPNDYIILTDNKVLNTINKEQLKKELDTEFQHYKDLFENPNDENLKANNNALTLIHNLNMNITDKEKLKNHLLKIAVNEKRVDFFNDMDIKKITINEYNQIEEFLLKLQEETTPITKGESFEEASTTS